MRKPYFMTTTRSHGSSGPWDSRANSTPGGQLAPSIHGDAAWTGRLADEIQRRLEPCDWLEAFAHHPGIGEAALCERFAATAEWSEKEQSGTARARTGPWAGVAAAPG